MGKSVCALLALLVAYMAATAAPAAIAADAAAEKLMEGGHWKRLRALVEPRLSANPNDADILYYLGRVKQEQGDLQGAMELAEKAVALNPNRAR